MKLDSEARVHVLTVGTALVVALVRHAVSKAPSWGGISQLLIWWVIHIIALYLLIFVANIAIYRWNKTFLGEDGDVLNSVRLQYYITMTSLVAAVAIFIVKTAGRRLQFSLKAWA